MPGLEAIKKTVLEGGQRQKLFGINLFLNDVQGDRLSLGNHAGSCRDSGAIYTVVYRGGFAGSCAAPHNQQAGQQTGADDDDPFDRPQKVPNGTGT